jgi:hypothetical protein
MPFTQIDGCMIVIDEIYIASVSIKNVAGIDIMVIFEVLTIFMPPYKIIVLFYAILVHRITWY